MLLQSTQVLREANPPRTTTIRGAAVPGSIPARLVKEPEERPLHGGRSQWMTPSGGIVSSLSRRVW